MKAAVFANVALFAATAAAHVRLPFAYRHSAFFTGNADTEMDILALPYSVNVTIGTPPQDFSLLLQMESDLTHVPHSEVCWSSPNLDFCPMGSCASGAFLRRMTLAFITDSAFFWARQSHRVVYIRHV